jgi:hypothetical protein
MRRWARSRAVAAEAAGQAGLFDAPGVPAIGTESPDPDPDVVWGGELLNDAIDLRRLGLSTHAIRELLMTADADLVDRVLAAAACIGTAFDREASWEA